MRMNENNLLARK